jgi:hypothetical protein
MKITVTWISKRLPELLWVNFIKLESAKADIISNVTIQNTSNEDIYLENWIDATMDGSYVLPSNREVTFDIANLANLSFITAWIDADIRIITN